MEVESKFNPDDWNGYLHTYETIEEYNAAKKLLPHTARIESTKEAKYIPKEKLGSNIYAKVDNFNWYNESIKDCIIDLNRHLNPTSDHWDWVYSNTWDDFCRNAAGKDYVYKLLGKISIGNAVFYLWELNQIFDEYIFSGDNGTGFYKRSEDVWYLLTDFKDVYTTYKGMDDNCMIHVGTCLNLDTNDSYSCSQSIESIALDDNGIDIENMPSYGIIFDIYEA